MSRRNMSRFFLIVGVLLGVAADAAPVPLIIDTDIGNDFDDTWALSYALSRRDVFDLKLVTTATGNASNRALLTCAYLQAAGRADVAVGVGLSSATTRFGPNGVGPQFFWVPANYTFDTYRQAGGRVFQDGVAALEHTLDALATEDAPALIVGLSPLSNLGDLFTRRPDLKARVAFATMGGSLRVGYDNSSTPSEEYNIKTNVSAAQTVYRQDWPANGSAPAGHGRFAVPICAAPLDTTWFFQIYGAPYARFYARATQRPASLAGLLLANYECWVDHHGGYGGPRPFDVKTTSSVLYDLQATTQAAVMVSRRVGSRFPDDACAGTDPDARSRGPFGLELSPLRVVVRSDGRTVALAGSDPGYASTRATYESVAWAGGTWNGTVALGEAVVDALLAASPP